MTRNPALWKARVDPYTGVTALPRGAEVLSAGVQGDEVVVWFRCDPDAPSVAHDVFAFGTGAMAMPEWTDTARFIGTVQFPNGLVFHIFDGGEPDAQQ